MTHRHRPAKPGVVERLFEKFDHHLSDRGYKAKGDSGEPGRESPNRLTQKNLDVRWTKRNIRSHYGYKNHVSCGRAPTSASGIWY